jgi:branched-chain amino acid transport system ATP-binding protein
VSALLEAAGLAVRFGAVRAVDGVDLALGPGDRHAVIGPNGAGKSTFLNLIAGTVRPSAGRVRLRGRDITRTAAAARARLGIARTFQTPAVLGSLTALDNVRVAGWPHRRGDPRDLLDALGLSAFATAPAGTLSHGQRRLLEIAMALVAEPAVLLLDEPAAGLDDRDLARLLARLRELPAGMAVLMVEHNQEVVAALADTVTVLHHGRVIASGRPAQVAADPAVVASYLGSSTVVTP